MSIGNEVRNGCSNIFYLRPPFVPKATISWKKYLMYKIYTSLKSGSHMIVGFTYCKRDDVYIQCIR